MAVSAVQATMKTKTTRYTVLRNPAPTLHAARPCRSSAYTGRYSHLSPWKEVQLAWYRTRCPVSTNAAGWINGSLDWCLAEFGSQTLNKPVLLPALDAVSTGYSGSGSDLESILARVCG